MFQCRKNLFWKQNYKEAKNKKINFLNDKLSSLISLNKIEQENNKNFVKEINLYKTKKLVF